ncbi:MAG TPA: MFS transporter [Firmicutes bacterium]|nr:MFS transporter [Bacillota bacterium]
MLLLGISHAIIDIYNGVIPALVPYLQDRYGLTYAAAGLILSVSNVTSSLIQPAFGLLSDFRGGRWIITAGLLLAAGAVALTGYISSYSSILLAVALSGIGVAIFHPQCARMAGRIATERRGTSMAIYSVGGNIGFALGPILLAVVLKYASPSAFWMIAIPGLLGALMVELVSVKSSVLREAAEVHAGNATLTSATSSGRQNLWLAEAVLLVIVALRSFVQYGVVAYMPQYAVRVLGQADSVRPMLQFLFLAFGAIGTIVGGILVDRLGRLRVLVLSFGILAPLHWALSHVSDWLFAILLAVEGFALVSTFSITLVMSQEYLPDFTGLASGLNVGFSVGMGGIGAGLIGMLADARGLAYAFRAIAILPLIAFALAFVLPRERSGVRTVSNTSS